MILWTFAHTGHHVPFVDRQLNLDSLRALPWRDFELLVGEAYRRQGYQVIERGGAHSDGGIGARARTLRRHGR
jgi:restriction system protein